MVNIEDIARVVDATVLNPALLLPVPFLLHYLYGHGFEISQSRAWATPTVSTTRAMATCLGLTACAAMLRWGRRQSRLALNNHVSDTWDFSASGKELALVTGGAGGIGGELVLILAAKGIDVVVLDIIPLQFKKPESGGKVNYYKCDLTDYDAYEKVAAQIQTEVGHPSLVFANAGIVRGKTLLEASKRDIEMTFGVNNLALIWTIKLFVPSLVEKNHGHFFITSSATAYTSTVSMVDYSATKAAALAIYEGLQAELKHVYNAPKVRVSVICPMLIRTKMFEGMSNPSEFFAPSLEPRDVAHMMADTVFAGESRHIITPGVLAGVMTIVRASPSWLRVGLQAGGSNATHGLKGHDPMKIGL